jgi:hypothetical protein
VGEVGKIVSEEGAAYTSLVVLGTKHEVVDDELLAALEKVGEGDLLSVQGGESVNSVDFDQAEFCALGGELVGDAESFFLLDEEGFAGYKPLLTGENLDVNCIRNGVSG